MFILSLTIFIFLFTGIEDIFLAGGILAVFLIVLSVLFSIQKENRIKRIKQIFLVILAFVLALTATSIKQYRYQQNIPTSLQYTGMIFSAKAEPQGTKYIGTGMIADTHSAGRYIFQDGKGRKYFLYSEQQYRIGDILWLTAYVSPGITGVSLLSQDILLKTSLTNLQNFNFSSGFEYSFNYPKRLMMKGMYGSLFEQNAIILENNPGKKIAQIRSNLQNLVIQSYGKNKISGLILGMLIGDRSQLPKDEYENFIDSGLVHIIAVSGGNIVMIVIFLSFALIRIPFYLRNGIILIFIVSYAFLCGLDSSVFRAMLMGGMSLLALFWGREVNIRRSLSISCIVMLLINPYFLIYDIGFLFSFSAIVGLVIIDHWQRKRTELILEKKIKISAQYTPTWWQKQYDKFLILYIWPTLGATIGVLPIMAFFIGKINLFGLIANIFILPVIPFVMIYGFISVVLYRIIEREWILWIEEILVRYIFRISDMTAQYGVYFVVEATWVKWILLISAVGIFVWWRLKKTENS